MTETRADRTNRGARTIAATIRDRRTERGESQEALAQNAGLSRAYMGRIESGRVNVSLGTLMALADALECSLADLVEGL